MEKIRMKSIDRNTIKDKFTIIRHSLRIKLTLTLTILIIFTIFFLWILNRTFLGNYYLYSKMHTLDETFTELNNLFTENSDTISSEQFLKTEQLRERLNIKIFIITSKFYAVFPSNENNQSVEMNIKIEDIFYEYILGENSPIREKDIIKSAGNYTIYKVHNKRLNSQYVDLFGELDNSYFVYIQSNYENMQEGVAIANQFLAYVGIISVIIGSGIMLYISKKFTAPVLELAGISKKMSDLDFDVKYEVTTKDEIGELGHSINTLSDILEKTISELKSANNELLSDLQDKIQIDEMRKDFLSNVTHELKTPIALIQGYAEGLRDNIHEDEESREFYCDVIIDEAQKMNVMVKKLLTLNQIEFGKNQINIERFDITALIQSVLDSSSILFKQKNITLRFEHTDPIYVWSDEYMVEEVVTNYISNALNHVSDANIIEVKIIEKSNVVRVAVFNTGSHIPTEDIDNIWIKFYKVDKARTREYGGSGIGLSIVKAIMVSLNQSFGVANRQGGVEFWFELDSKLE